MQAIRHSFQWDPYVVLRRVRTFRLPNGSIEPRKVLGRYYPRGVSVTGVSLGFLLREKAVMADLKLVLKFRIDGEAGWRVRSAARISVDRGRLTLVRHSTRALETIPLSRITALSIQSVSGVRSTAVAV